MITRRRTVNPARQGRPQGVIAALALAPLRVAGLAVGCAAQTPRADGRLID